MIENIIDYLPSIILLIGVIGFLISLMLNTGKITKADMYKIVEIAVKSAELKYINANGDFDRASFALNTICNLLGKTELDATLYDNIMAMIDAVVNDLPKTSERLKQ